MKVAYLLGSLNRGGTETLVLDIFKKASVTPFELMCIHRKDGTYRADFQATGQKIVQLTPKFPGDLVYLVRLRRLLQKEQVTVVHAQQYLDAMYARLACLGTDIKIVETFHGYDFDAKKWVKRLMKLSLQWCDAVFFVSESQKRYYTESYQLKNTKKIHVVYNGVNFEKMDAVPSESEKKCPEAILRFGSVGNFVSVREQMTLCKFLNLLHQKGVEFDFSFVGAPSKTEPWRYEECVQYCREHGLSDCVHFLGSRNDVPQLLRSWDAFVYSTDHDTFGIAVIEAIAAGLTTFVNDWEVMTEITQQGKWATLYKTKNEHDLLEKFIIFVGAKEHYEKQAKQNALGLRDAYSIKQHIAMLSELYENL